MEIKSALDKVKDILLQKEKELERLKQDLKKIGKNYLEGELYLVCVNCGNECPSIDIKGHWSRYLYREYGQNKKAVHIPKTDAPKLQDKINRGKERRDLIQQREVIQNQIEQAKKITQGLLDIFGCSSEEEKPARQFTYQDFKSLFKKSFQIIDQAQRRKGIIPIHHIFEDMLNSLDKDQFTQHLEKMFRDRLIELIPAYRTDLTKEQMNQAIYLQSTGKKYYSVKWRE